jgi:glycerol-3-phosphate dehydrogenase
MTPSNTPHFDLVIIGAGINGAGIARDAAMRGLKTLLLDKGDIASGTSSLSTRLIHGGLRYLEHWEFGLVRESLRERENLLRIAPHLVRPIPILIPIYQSGRRGKTTIRAGLIAYDLLSFDKTLPAHRMLSRTETLQRYSGLNPAGLIAGALYYDCHVEFAERLVLENVLSAKAYGTEVLTHSCVTRIEGQTVQFIRRDSGKDELVKGELIINASGPWVDQLLARSNSSTQRLIGGTKGSHIVVRQFAGAPATAVYIEAETDQRPFFVIPWNRNYLIGTTDVRFENNIDDVRSELWEVDYLLKETNRVFPEASLVRDDVCYTYSGVRPLPFTDEVDEQSITRRHFIREHPESVKLLSIVGGKLTTYRSLAEECVNLVFRKLGKRPARCRTHEIRLPGAVDFSGTEGECEFSKIVIDRLLRIYGSRTRELIELCSDSSALIQPFNKGGDALAGEVVFAFESELAVTLADCLLRRTMIGLNSDLAIGDDEKAAEIGKQFLSWSDQRAKDEVLTYRSLVERFLVDYRDSNLVS